MVVMFQETRTVKCAHEVEVGGVIQVGEPFAGIRVCVADMITKVQELLVKVQNCLLNVFQVWVMRLVMAVALLAHSFA